MSDNDDLDAELLALAGGESEPEEADEKELKRSRSPSKAPSVASQKAEKPKSPIKRGVAQRKPKSRSRAAPKPKKKIELSEEEGEASDVQAPAASLGSGVMSESDAEAARDGVDGKNDEQGLFPVDGLFHSEKEKEEILSMSEIRREEILAERAAEAERRTQDLHLRRLLQARERDEAKAGRKKRKAGAAELEDSARKSTRLKTKASESLEAYKRSREQRGEQRKRDDERRDRDKRSPSADRARSDADGEGESEVEWDDTKKDAPAVARDEAPAEFKDFERVRVGRSNFAKVCFYPGFEDAIRGCFCRVSIGVEKATGRNVYRVAQIKGFTEGKPYAIEAPNGKTITTNQYAVIAHGKSEKEWPFLACSDSKFSDQEYDRWQRMLVAENIKPPSKTYLSNKLNDIHNLLNRRWTDAEIQEKLRRSGVIASKSISSERARIIAEREAAVEAADEAAIAHLDAELRALTEGPKLAFGTSLAKRDVTAAAARAPTQQERMAALNRQNRRANVDAIRKAQIAERKAEARAQAAVARGEALANPFARVKTRAKMHHDVLREKEQQQQPEKETADGKANHKALEELFGAGSDISRTVTPMPGGAPGAGTGTGTGTATPVETDGGVSLKPPSSSGAAAKKSGAAPEKKGLPTFRKRNMDDDLLASMDLGIEIDI